LPALSLSFDAAAVLPLLHTSIADALRRLISLISTQITLAFIIDKDDTPSFRRHSSVFISSAFFRSHASFDAPHAFLPYSFFLRARHQASLLRIFFARRASSFLPFSYFLLRRLFYERHAEAYAPLRPPCRHY
jgi:hypothetical protein